MFTFLVLQNVKVLEQEFQGYDSHRVYVCRLGVPARDDLGGHVQQRPKPGQCEGDQRDLAGEAKVRDLDVKVPNVHGSQVTVIHDAIGQLE